MERHKLEKLVNEGLSQYAIASKLKCSQTNVRHWLKKYGLRTLRVEGTESPRVCKECGEQNQQKFYRSTGHICRACFNKDCLKRQQESKILAVQYMGGKCQNPNCPVPGGYKRYPGALEFHHTNPKNKDPKIRFRCLRQSFDKLKKELDKCILLCAICHREEHARIRGLL